MLAVNQLISATVANSGVGVVPPPEIVIRVYIAILFEWEYLGWEEYNQIRWKN